jgi:formate hydrogenlyase subunit 3/multisubunit Na+/H+ antiporter MnhD subunit
MPFAVVALVLGALTLGGFAAGGGPNAETLSALALLKPDSFETLAVGLVLCALLVLLLVPGALVRLLYGRRPVSRSEAPSLGLAEGSSVGGARGGFDAGFRKSEEV